MYDTLLTATLNLVLLKKLYCCSLLPSVSSVSLCQQLTQLLVKTGMSQNPHQGFNKPGDQQQMSFLCAPQQGFLEFCLPFQYILLYNFFIIYLCFFCLDFWLVSIQIKLPQQLHTINFFVCHQI